MMLEKGTVGGVAGLLLAVAGGVGVLATPSAAGPTQSVARQWNEQLLESIRNDFARPTVHARNLYHVSVAMYDAWAAYDEHADGVLFTEKVTAEDIQAAREEAISFAAYRVLKARFASSPGADMVLPSYDALMDALGYDKDYKGTLGDTPAAVGNRIALTVLFHGFNDNANEQGGYANQYYEPVNPALAPAFPGNPDLVDPNRWQPLALKDDCFIDQAGNIICDGYPEALSPEWGIVTPFSLRPEQASIYERDGFDYWVYLDPGPPPQIGGENEEYYKWGFELVSMWSSHLDPADGVMWDISPGSIGNAPLPDPSEYEDFYDRVNGGDWGTGYAVNPVTGEPYEAQIVPRGDYARILAEFWADGPDSETPPGHWFVLLNYVSDHPLVVKQLGGEGPVLDDLEWDVKTYLALGGGMHDIAIACWGTKGWYDYIRPVSAIRYMTDQGQSSEPKAPDYDPDGIRLIPGFIERVTAKTTMPGGIHEHLAGEEGKIAILAWRGPDYITDPAVDVAGVAWILAENWWPYQRPTFITPPFPGYTSGHSTYSRGAALIMTELTGSDYFPGGLGEFACPKNEFLVFEDGPSMNVTLQWARYLDASDQCSLSRIWGGIHPPADDIPGRIMGQALGPQSFCEATRYFNGKFTCPSDVDGDRIVGIVDFLEILAGWDSDDCNADVDRDGVVGCADFIQLITEWGVCP